MWSASPPRFLVSAKAAVCKRLARKFVTMSGGLRSVLVYGVRNRGHSPRPIPATAALLRFDLSPNKPAAKRLAAAVLDSRITTHLSDAVH